MNPRPRLAVTDSRGERTIPIGAGPFTLGRRTTADLQIVGGDVSREHAEIAFDGTHYVITDVGSRFGTFVNDAPVTAARVLAHGDRIRLGARHEVAATFLVDDDSAMSLLSSGTGVSNLEQMTAILNGLRALGSGRVLDEVLTLVLDSALDVTRAERGFIMLADATRELQWKVARGRGQQTLPGTSFTTSAKIPRQVFASGRSLIVADLFDSDIPGGHDGTLALGIRHVLCVPLTVATYDTKGAAPAIETIGVLYLDGRERGSLLSPQTLSSLEAFATQAALAIDSARLYAQSAEKAALDRDLRTAAAIQRALLPPPLAAGSYFSLAATSLPCRTIGGDFFDYLDLGAIGLSFALGDVAGKGPPAALLAATVQSNFAALAAIGKGPAATMTAINQALLRRAIDARFTTMFHGVLFEDGRLSYCNAGHEPPALVRADGRVEELHTGGPVVGLFASARYEAAETTLGPGDLVVVCSDGVTEAQNDLGEEYGRARVTSTVSAKREASPTDVLDALVDAVTTFGRSAPQADDLTALVLRYR